MEMTRFWVGRQAICLLLGIDIAVLECIYEVLFFQALFLGSKQMRGE